MRMEEGEDREGGGALLEVCDVREKKNRSK